MLKNLKNDKKGIIGIVVFFLILFTILVIGFIAVIAISALGYASDTITPIMQDLGVVGSTNLSQASQYTFGTVDTIVDMLPFLLVFSYVAMLIFSILFVVAYQFNPHPAYIGIYFLFVVLMIFGSIIMSNMYQDLYTTNDPIIGTGLQNQAAMSFLILHSPLIFVVIAFIVGIYIFAGNKDNAGGFDV